MEKSSDVWSHLLAEALVLSVQLLHLELLLLHVVVVVLQSLDGRLQLPVFLLQLQHPTGDALVQLVHQGLACCSGEQSICYGQKRF